MPAILDLTYVKDGDYTCPDCGWVGSLTEAEARHVSSSPEEWLALAGREGYEYYCPSCDHLLTSFYSRIS